MGLMLRILQQKKIKEVKTYNRRDSQMVTHSSTSRPVQCLCMAERTGCPVLTDLWSYVSTKPELYVVKISTTRPVAQGRRLIGTRETRGQLPSPRLRCWLATLLSDTQRHFVSLSYQLQQQGVNMIQSSSACGHQSIPLCAKRIRMLSYSRHVLSGAHGTETWTVRASGHGAQCICLY
jgi:hypothetical protein